MANTVTQAKSVVASKLETELTEVDAGVLKDIPAKTAITVNGTAMTPAQIDAKVKGYLQTIQAADTAKQQYQTALVARRNIQIEARDFFLQIKKAVIAFFGAQAAQLADFGLTPAKAKAPRTSAQKAVSAAKAQLTRAARGTTSKKQKQTINPSVGTPQVTIGSDGKASVTAPLVVNPGDPVPPGLVAPSGSTPQNSAGSGSGSALASPGNAAGGSTPSGK